MIFEELLFNPDKVNNLDETFEGTLFADVLGKKPFFFKNGKLVKGNFNVFLDTLNLGFWKGI